MSDSTIFLEDAYGEGWENEIGEEGRMPEPILETVRGLTAARYKQLWSLFQGTDGADVLSALANGMSVAEVANAVGVSQRQVKNVISQVLVRVAGVVAQKSFLPPARAVATSLHIERRPRSRRGRPPKDRKSPPPTTSAQVPLPF
jgi:lambda repressor-like predicted transcriptional regulator